MLQGEALDCFNVSQRGAEMAEGLYKRQGSSAHFTRALKGSEKNKKNKNQTQAYSAFSLTIII